jgi:hypothetical protein
MIFAGGLDCAPMLIQQLAGPHAIGGLAAAASRGLPRPQSDRPASAILMSAEDDPARTIVPRGSRAAISTPFRRR